MEEETKAGRRMRGSMVKFVEDIIDNMKAVLVWARYEDDEEDEKQRLPSATVGDIERSRGQLRTGGGPSRGGTPNWSAKVGQIIIGNLMRGEGGRFASARNIAKITRMLEDEGITPNMFQGMQGLLAGSREGVSADTMANLLDAGLIDESGAVQAKAGEIINAIKTGNPDNLRQVFSPSGGGGSGGGGGGGSDKPSKEEKQAANVNELMPEVVTRSNLTEDEIRALIDFFDGADLPSAQIEGLMDAGLVAEDAEGNLYMTASGRSLVRNMRQGDLREALDAISRGIGKPEEEDTDDGETQANINEVSEDLTEDGVMTQAQINTLLGFDENAEDVSGEDLASLIDLGLVDINTRGQFYMTGRGGSLIRTMERGDTRDALDTISQAQVSFDRSRESAKGRRAEQMEKLIDREVMSREQADAMIRGWINADMSDVDEETMEQLAAIGLMDRDGQPTAYGKWFMRTLDVASADEAEAVLDRLSGSKQLAGMKSLGDGWFITWTSNAFEDREGETFTTKSIEDYLKAVDQHGIGSQTYDFWHIDGMEFADVQWCGGQGRFLVEIGKFKETPVGQGFKAFFEKYPNGHPEMAPYGWGCSHKYVYYPPDRDDGVYDWFAKRKSTVLPLHEAANPFTLAEFGLGGKSMELSKKQRRSLTIIAEEVGMPELTDRIEKLGNNYTQFLEDQGVEYKALKACECMECEYTTDEFEHCADQPCPECGGQMRRMSRPGVGDTTETKEEALSSLQSNIGMVMDLLGEGEMNEDTEAEVRGLLKETQEMLSAMTRDKAKWSTEYVNDLDDSAFLWIAPGGEEDDEGKTVPRSLRYFPYKNHEGNVDLPHLRNAIARIPQAKHEDLSESKKEELQAEARRLLEEHSKSVQTDKGGDMNREQVAAKMAELTDDMPEEQKEDWGEAAEKVSQPESDVSAIHRMLMEMISELPEEARAQAEELVTALAEIASVEEDVVEEVAPEEMEPEDTEVTEEAMTDEEVAVTSNGEEEQKSADTDQLVGKIVDALDLKGLSDVIEGQHKTIETLETTLKGVNERIEKLEAAQGDMDEVKEEVKQVKEQTDAVVGEKQMFTPFWGNGALVGSVAREEELTDEQHKEYRKPEVPNAIASIRDRIRNNS